MGVRILQFRCDEKRRDADGDPLLLFQNLIQLLHKAVDVLELAVDGGEADVGGFRLGARFVLDTFLSDEASFERLG